MKIHLIFAASMLVFIFVSVQSGAAQATPMGDWTGGFFTGGNWVIVDVRFNREKETLRGNADVTFPSYSNSVSARNVELKSLKSDAAKIEFEIPFNTEKIVFRGQMQEKTISGEYEYATARGDFGLTRIVSLDAPTLEKYYGAYRVSPDRVISIFRSLSDPRAVWFIDYKTGRVGTLWAEAEDRFFTGDGRGISYPATLKVSFAKDSNGTIKDLKWQSATEPDLAAQKISLKEEAITFQNGRVTLGGTLILPPGGGQYPVVIVTPGDFGTNRNQLRWWAHNFASRGIAALIFDSRGAGASGGTAGSNSFDVLANDVLAAVGVLKNRADINPKKIGLFGFSNSAWTVSLAASRSTDVGFLILQSLSGVPPFEQEIFRAETQLRADKFPENTIKKGGDFMRLKFGAARTGAGWEQIEKIMNAAQSERWLAYTNPPRSLEGLQRFWNAGANYNPAPALEKLKIPVLAFWGANDTYVPAQKSIAVFKRAMTKAGNTNYTIKFIPKGRHDLVEGESGSPSIGARLKKFPAGFWKMQIDWILSRVKTAG
ncbi:MAG TPA: alpha/beta fold hydrolase [Pyrinomonadaceae bacterium]|jgi:dienelactone hydrolase